MKVAVIINKAAGISTGPDPALTHDSVREAFQLLALDAEIHVCPGRDVSALARSLIRPGLDALVAGGGDGTISSVARLLAGGSLPLGILPLGTRNHFARDLGIPTRLTDAVQIIARGHVVRIDAAEVNGHLFINNSSIGAYPRAVEERQDHQTKLGLPKWLAMIVATLALFRRFPLIRAHLQFNGEEVVRSTPFVFVGNNVYAMNFFDVKFRSCLTAGTLCVYTARCTGVFCLLKLFWHSLRRRLDQSRDFDSWTPSEVVVRPHRRRIRVSLDGEVVRMAAPLHYRIHRAALPVLAPHAP
jgi:diacylglycerol kinase family enzyme